MEVQIQELIDKIKSEGVGQAESRADEIIKEAEAKKTEIIASARKEAEKIIAGAKDEALKFEATGKQAVSQAGRDLILNVKSSLTAIFNSLINKEIQGAMGKDFLESTLSSVVKAWVEKGSVDVEILLSDADKKKLESFFSSKLSAELKKGVTVKASPSISAGFRIAEKDGSSFFDITDQGLADSLKPFLNEKLSASIADALK